MPPFLSHSSYLFKTLMFFTAILHFGKYKSHFQEGCRCNTTQHLTTLWCVGSKLSLCFYYIFLCRFPVSWLIFYPTTTKTCSQEAMTVQLPLKLSRKRESCFRTTDVCLDSYFSGNGLCTLPFFSFSLPPSPHTHPPPATTTASTIHPVVYEAVSSLWAVKRKCMSL